MINFSLIIIIFLAVVYFSTFGTTTPHQEPIIRLGSCCWVSWEKGVGVGVRQGQWNQLIKPQIIKQIINKSGVKLSKQEKKMRNASTLLGLRKFNVPIWGVISQFAIGGIIYFFTINKIQSVMEKCRPLPSLSSLS